MKIFLALLLMIMQQTTVSASDSLVYWGRRLNFSDFQSLSNYNEIESAVSYVGFECNYDYDTDLGKFDFQVKAFFNPKKSWIKDKDSSSLIHEQIHFDIAELFARRLCTELSNIKIDYNIDKKIDSLIKHYSELMKAYQALYDKKTLSGANLSEQKKWLKRISNELDSISRCQTIPLSRTQRSAYRITGNR